MVTAEVSLDDLKPLSPHLRNPDYDFAVGPGWREIVLQSHWAVVTEFPEYELLAVKQKGDLWPFRLFPAHGGPEVTGRMTEHSRLHMLRPCEMVDRTPQSL